MAKSNGSQQDVVEYEFGGPIGAFFTIIFLPLTVYGLSIMCTAEYCLDITALGSVLDQVALPQMEELWSLEVFCIFLSWFFFQVVLERVLPANIAEGVALPDGSRLKYRINGFGALIVTLAVVLIASFGLPPAYRVSLSYIYDHYLQFATSAIVFSSVLSVYLYISACRPGRLLAKGGNTGNRLYDFYIGHELNPRIGSFDLKEFCELRPGLIGWVLINVGCMAKQYELHGTVSGSMVLVNVFQFIYVFDALWNEKAILTTMDITTDGFGFMLAFGDLVWVPFTYTLQAKYLVDYDPHMGVIALAVIVAVMGIGYIIFRGANGQKDAFRRDPNHPSVKHINYINTERGTRLMISGWWGIARHINYLGDWVMAWAWCLPCGFRHIIPYFYVIYFAILLVHRDLRDEHACKMKYGKDWDRYCAIVKYHIIPYIY